MGSFGIKRGYLNLQPIQVLNKSTEYGSELDSKNPKSMIYGDPRDSKEGGCYYFKGEGDGLSIDLPYELESFKFSTYLFRDVASRIQEDYIHILGDGNSGGVALVHDSEGLGIRLNSQIHYFDKPDVETSGIWINVGVEIRSSELNLFINKQLVSTHEIQQPLVTDFKRVVFNPLNTNFKVFGVEIYEPRNGTLNSNLLVLLKGDESEGRISFDSSGNGINGSLTTDSLHDTQTLRSYYDEVGYSRFYDRDISVAPAPTYSEMIYSKYLEDGIIESTVERNINSSLFFDMFGVSVGTLPKYLETYKGGIELKFRMFIPEPKVRSQKLIKLVFREFGRDIEKFLTIKPESFGVWLTFTEVFHSQIGIILDRNLFRLQIQGLSSSSSFSEGDKILFDTKEISITPLNIDNVIIPRDESRISRDVLGNPLLIKGRCPQGATYKGSNALNISNSDCKLVFGDSIPPEYESEITFETDGGVTGIHISETNKLSFSGTGAVWDIKIPGFARLPLCEFVTDLDTHVCHDVTGHGNHASMEGFNEFDVRSNNLLQDSFHWLQRGFSRYNDSERVSYIPSSEVSGIDALGNPILVNGSNHAFLNTGCKLVMDNSYELKRKDVLNFYFDIEGNPKEKEFSDFAALMEEYEYDLPYFFGTKDRDTGQLSENYVSHIVLHEGNLTRLQKLTELDLREVFHESLNWLLRGLEWRNEGEWDNTAFFNVT